MSQFRSIFRQISTNNSYQVKDYGPNNRAVSTFAPDDIAGLTGWIDANDSTSITLDGDFVDSVTNKGSVTCTWQANVAAARPFLSASLINTRDVISFDGVDDILSSSVGAGTLFGATTPTTYTYGVVMKPNRIGTSNANPYALDVITGMASSGWTVTVGTSQGLTSRLWHDFGSSDAADYVTSRPAQVVSGSTMSMIITFAAKTYSMYINGTFVGSTTRSVNTTVGLNSVRIGNEIFPSGGDPALFDLCELVLYSTEIAAADIATLTDYFDDKWGI
jgi:hypothetical protein